MSASIEVVGGAYVEECSYPRSTVYRGSGMRAACVLAGLGQKVSLHTVLGEDLSSEFATIASLQGFALHAARRPHAITFQYRHPLDKPDIDVGGSQSPQQVAAIELEDVLVFGMLEGRPVVHANRVVYDPQDGASAEPFHKNGSTAKHLAIVASASEAQALTGESILSQPLRSCCVAAR